MTETVERSLAKRGRRKLLRQPLGWAAAGALALALYSLALEPNWIQVARYDFSAPVLAPLKIAQLSDLHTHGFGFRERRVVQLLQAEKPDLIVVTGDTLANHFGGYDKSRQVYEKLRAPLGVWFVRGNWENYRPIRPLKRERDYYESEGVHLLLNSNAHIRDRVWLAGVDDPYSGAAKLNSALAGIPPQAFTILLFHSPAYFDIAAGRAQLCLAGHSHGGQVRLPWVRPVWLPAGCGRFIQGWYQERGSRMYVSRGLGMSILPIRFLCRPELVFITLRP